MASKALSTMAAAQFCGVHYTTIRRWILAGDLSAFETPGGHLRIRKEDIDAFIASRRHVARTHRRPGRTCRVLVVDDEDVFRSGVVEFLARDARFEVQQAADGFAAGRLVAEFRPEVVLLDLLMPGVDGFEVCRQIKSAKRSRNTRVLVLTGFPTDENMKRAIESGADVCCAKPMELEEIRDQILNLIGARPQLNRRQ